MIKRAGLFLVLPLLNACPAIAAVPELTPDGAGSWPWIAAGGLLVTLGAIALISRRRMPFGKRD
jgi:hypothetical protein